MEQKFKATCCMGSFERIKEELFSGLAKAKLKKMIKLMITRLIFPDLESMLMFQPLRQQVLVVRSIGC
jgi:hypothetical protein